AQLDRAALGRALSAVVARHEILRTRYDQVDDVPRQVIDPARPVPITEHPPIPADATADFLATRGERPFDLAGEGPIRADLAPVDGGGYVLLLTVHHIAF